ncbi:MAG: hypothetical protein HC884_02700 [Chloroflexaceae bacterium]|nr:hypothetical protein [Chloroflexaceae bacterium]
MAPFAVLWGTMRPAHTIRIHGIDYAAIYQMPPTTFGAAIHLRRSTLDSAAARDQGFLTVTAKWECRETPATTCRTAHLTLRVLNSEGQQVSQATRPLLPPDRAWRPGETPTATYTVPLAVENPPGTYRVGLSLSRPPSAPPGGGSDPDDPDRSPSPLLLDNPFHHPYVIDGGKTLLLEPFSLPLEPYFGPSIHLRRHEIDTSAVEPGRPDHTLLLHVGWSATALIPTDYTLFVHVLNDRGERVAQIDPPPAGSTAPTGSWQVGQEQSYTHRIPLPPDLPAGSYWLALGLYDSRTLERLPVRGAPPPPDGLEAGPDALWLQVRLPATNDEE